MEQLLLPAGQQFDRERRDIIRYTGSVDVNACPGSGKTTVMLAKLLLIAEQMPFRNNQGICVLTHTNVAINEIKDRLGLSDTCLFKYPNHFGTIQSFINKFLGIPGYTAKFPGKRPSIIDRDWYNNVIAQRYAGWYGAGRAWLDRRTDPIALLQSYQFNPSFDNLLTKTGEPVFQNNGAAFDDIFNFRMQILEDGILSYNDAYVLAAYYLQKYPNVSLLLQQRFPLIIIDEMQDTDSHQLALLNQVFDPARTVVQRIGDYNQAIFNKVDAQAVWTVGTHVLPLSGSKRFSPRIAGQIDRICLTPRNMSGNRSMGDLQPRIILFSQPNILQVIPHFTDLVIEMDIPAFSSKPCKAVGWVKEKEVTPPEIKNCIRSYWPDFEAVNRVQKTDYDNLSEYLAKPDDRTVSLKGTSYYWERMLFVFLKLLRITQKRKPDGAFYSKTSLTFRLKADHAFYELLQTNMVQWIRKIQYNENVVPEIRQFISQRFCPIFDIAADQEVNNFLNDQNMTAQQQQVNTQRNDNVFKHTYSGTNIQHADKQLNIHVNSIHRVKGETHAATLYLETFYHAHDIRRVLNYLKIGQGSHLPAQGPRMIETLKMAYVAMSRPSHYLCVAMNNDGITAADIADLENAGWFVDVSLT